MNFILQGVLLFALFLKGVVLSDQSSDDDNNDEFFDLTGDIDFETADPSCVLYFYINNMIPALPDGYLLRPDINISDFCNFIYSERGAVYASENIHEVFFPESSIFLCDATKIPSCVYESIPPFDEIILSDCYKSISNEFLSNMVRHLSLSASNSNQLNMASFHKNLNRFPLDALTKIPFPFALPHLIDFSLFTEDCDLQLPENLLKCPSEDNTADIFIWNISTQMLLFQIYLHDSLESSVILPVLLEARDSALQAARESNSVDLLKQLNTNFLDSTYLQSFTPDLVSHFFGIPQPLANTSTISEISSQLNLISPKDFDESGYSKLSVRNRILYRTMVYLSIFNNSPDRVKLLPDLVAFASADDFTAVEIDFFVRSCINFNLISIIAAILRRSPLSIFTKVFWMTVVSKVDGQIPLLHSVFNSMDVADKLQFLLLKYDMPDILSQILLEDEDRFLSLQTRKIFLERSSGVSSTATAAALESSETETTAESLIQVSPLVRTRRLKRKGSQDILVDDLNEKVNANIAGHFINPSDFNSISSLAGSNQLLIEKVFTIAPLPNQKYASDRVNHFLQSLAEPDFGETAWETGNKNDPEYLGNEASLDEFVKTSLQVVYFASQQHPDSFIDVLFKDNSGYGDGLFNEMMNMLAELIILPKFNIFMYNPKLAHFLPTPLLHKEMMGTLGYMMGWFLKQDNTINWPLAPAFSEFLFYEENTQIHLRELVKTLYSSIFRELEKYEHVGPEMFDYLPSTFHANLPVALSNNLPATPFNLLSPNLEYHNISHYMAVNADDMMDTEKENLIISDTQRDDPMKIAFSQYISIVESELVDHLLIGRFYLIRQFFSFFHKPALPFLNHRLFLDLMELQKLNDKNPVTFEKLIPGLIYDPITNPIKIIDEFGTVYTPEEALIAILKSFPPHSLLEFYRFCTGCYRLPIGGLESKPIQISPTNEQTKFPAAKTCFRQLIFHLRPTLQALRLALIYSIENSEGYNMLEQGQPIAQVNQ